MLVGLEILFIIIGLLCLCEEDGGNWELGSVVIWWEELWFGVEENGYIGKWVSLLWFYFYVYGWLYCVFRMVCYEIVGWCLRYVVLEGGVFFWRLFVWGFFEGGVGGGWWVVFGLFIWGFWCDSVL